MTTMASPKVINFEERKKLGIFYTPTKVTEILCKWAIREPEDFIFEPGFGGCGFLESSYQRLKQLSNKNPIKQLYGCDVDENAFEEYLVPRYSSLDSLIRNRFKEKDFLELEVSEFQVNGFSSVIGNPPYISYHKMSERQRSSARQISKNWNIGMDKRASLWAYFLLHSFSFLNQGGRIAFVLPGSFLHAGYSNEIRKVISDNFQKSIVIQLGQRIFASEGTEENTAILLAEGWKTANKKEKLKIHYSPDVENLENFITSWNEGLADGVNFNTRVNHSLLSDDPLRAINKIERENVIVTLGDLAEILIGIVTGANKFFVINTETARMWNLSNKSLSPIFSRFQFAKGINLTATDLDEATALNHRCLFVDNLKTQENLELKVYFWSFSEEEKLKNVTFQKRPFWYQPLDSRRIPGGFFSYMHHEGPRLILNSVEINSTNTIHRVFFKERILIKERESFSTLSSTEKKLTAISLLSTYSQLSAELEGRVYGSGVLKHEPTEVKKIKLLWKGNLNAISIGKAFTKIDGLLRKGFSDQAREFADKFLFNGTKYQREIKILDEAIKGLRNKRYSKEQAKL